MTRRPSRLTTAQILASILAGITVVVLLLPARGVDSDPPKCRSGLGYTVPCGNGISLAAGAATAGGFALVLWLRNRQEGE
jgi:hypothetical protein